jgi:dTDP-4-dehydrorhamnose reductase
MVKKTWTAKRAALELWGGVECTVARVGDLYRDETAETGHLDRASDIDLVAGLGVRTVRYPILWETIAPERPDRLDFGWTDERLEMLRARGIGIVGGLLHHGSGPLYTSLTDPDFPKKFSEYAARVAERYPWIEQWTPINEPLTTARFSGLYGHWYPHGRSEGTFFRALVNQCLGTLGAMGAIRAVNPGALLLQTEDLGKTFSTAPLRYQATHDNARRWLGFDLLGGKVDHRHPFRRALADHGIGATELALLESGAAKPDILGINHYLTSERFLDHRVELYPELEAGGNGRDRYVDAEAVRVKRLHGQTGIAPRLREAWERYGIPIVISEVHHGCSRDEQLRWFAEVWEQAGSLRREGVDVRAVTLWSLFGSVDWRSLLTRTDGVHDVGAFDARSPEPRPTVIARAARAFSQGSKFDHPVLDSPGWWRRPARLYPWNERGETRSGAGRSLLITGATGTLGRAFARICDHRGLPFRLTGRDQLDITNKASIRRAIETHRPWAVINCAGFVRVAEAEQESEACRRANADGAENLAQACAKAGLQLVTFSSDLVFDGARERPYVETDPVNPTTVYGLSKAAAEARVLALGGQPLVIRTSAFFGPWDRHNFASKTIGQLARGEPVLACRTTIVSPTYVPDLVHAALDLLIDGETGIWHLANQGQLSWHAFAQRIASGAGYDPLLVLPLDSQPPTNTALGSARGMLLRPLDHAIDDYLRQVGLWVAPSEMSVAAE